MLNAKYEGTLSAFFRIGTPATAGQVVMLDPDNPGMVKVSDGTDAYGFLAQDVKDTPAGEYRPLVGEVAYVDSRDGVGVYTGGGVYYTDQFVNGTYKPGDVLYVTSGGKLTNAQGTPSATEGNVAVGVVEEVDANGLRFKAFAEPMIMGGNE